MEVPHDLTAEPEQEQRPSKPKPSKLSASRVSVILIAFLGVQLITSVVVVFAIAFVMALKGYDLSDSDLLAKTALAPAVLIAGVLSGSVVLSASFFWFRKEIFERGPLGGAWVSGSSGSILLGLLSGIFLSFAYLLVIKIFGSNNETCGPVAEMAATPGISQALWSFYAILVAPPVEELTFRGVVYAGFRRSWGPFWAATITTGSFVLLHITEVAHYWPSAVFVTAIAVVALWLRLSAKAVGPAMAAHFGYNSLLVLTVLYA